MTGRAADRVCVLASTDWASEIAAWVLFLVAAGKPETTRYLRTYQVRRLARGFVGRSPWSLSLDDLAGWLGGHDWAPETRRSYRASLRTFYGWGHITGRIGENPAAQLPAVTPPIGKPRPMPEELFREAMRAADERVRLMLALAGTEGLRRGEVARVHTDDVEPDLIGWTLRVHGKGRRQRRVPLHDELARELRRRPAGFVFPGQVDGHLSPAYVGKLISRALPDGWTAHPLRHRFAARFYEAERDIRAVQEALGHASVRTTQIYTPVTAGALRAGVLAAA